MKTVIFPGGAKFTAADMPAENNAPSRIVERSQFINSLTDGEIQALLAKAKTSIEIEAFLFRLRTTGDGIDLDNEHVVSAMAAMVSASVINQARSNEIRKL